MVSTVNTCLSMSPSRHSPNSLSPNNLVAQSDCYPIIWLLVQIDSTIQFILLIYADYAKMALIAI